MFNVIEYDLVRRIEFTCDNCGCDSEYEFLLSEIIDKQQEQAVECEACNAPTYINLFRKRSEFA